ncbi:hypothetical protein JCM10449v2_005981 [Rhodotorula kratochvilovae]
MSDPNAPLSPTHRVGSPHPPSLLPAQRRFSLSPSQSAGVDQLFPQRGVFDGTLAPLLPSSTPTCATPLSSELTPFSTRGDGDDLEATEKVPLTPKQEAVLEWDESPSPRASWRRTWLRAGLVAILVVALIVGIVVGIKAATGAVGDSKSDAASSSKLGLGVVVKLA